MVDQLHNQYRMEHWLHNYKWWHAIFWCGFQVLLVNSYKVYFCVMESAGAKPVLHYEFNRDCALVWIDPDEYVVAPPGY